MAAPLRLTSAEFRALGGAAGRGNKFNARRTTDGEGRTFDSAGEEAHNAALELRQRIGEISGLRRQVRFALESNGVPVVVGRGPGTPNGRRVFYVADFVYAVVATGETVIEDFKGYDTPTSKLKRAVLETMGFKVALVGPAASGRRRPHRRKKSSGGL